MIINEPELGAVGLVQVEGFTGHLIGVGEWLNGTPWRLCRYQHSLLYLGNDQALEAQPGGAVITSVSERYSHRPLLWLRVASLSDEQKTQLVATALKLRGTPYSFLDYAALPAHRLHLPIPGLREYVASTKHMICSQIIDEVYKRIGVPLFNGRWSGYVTPADYARVYGGES